MLKHNFEELPSLTLTHPGLWGSLLFGPFALALLCYIWAFCSQSQSRRAFGEFIVLSLKRRGKDLRGAQNTYNSAFALLLFDGFTVICGLVWGIMMFCDSIELVWLIFLNIWRAFRFLSVCQHLITALISVIFLYHPTWGGGLHSVSKVLYVVPFILVILSFRINDAILIGVDVYNLLLMLVIVVFSCYPSSSSMAKQRKPFLLLSVAMFFLICLPNAVMNCLVATSDDYVLLSSDVLLITNFYIVMDGLMFYLVLRIKEEDRSENQYECAIRSA